MLRLTFDNPATYRIRVQSTLDQSWSERLQGMTITNASDDDAFPVAALTGRLIDQAALAGVLTSLYGLGLPLLTVECLSVHPCGAGYPDSTFSARSVEGAHYRDVSLFPVNRA